MSEPRLSAATDLPDQELVSEQEHLESAEAALVAMRLRAERLLEDMRAAGKPDLDYEAALSRRITALGASRRPLLFGRIDELEGATWRIGRRHVEEDSGDVLVVDWRAPVSTPFYRARPGEPLGLRRRRQIMVDADKVLAVADDLFDVRDDDVSSTRLRGGDALLLELERSRTGEMLDIVATIQAEQDEIIRGPLDGLVVVQGGPGTGKTAVGLHRAAYLLYNYPELARSGVLIIGPSRAFLRYVAQVLPSLGEEAVVQTTIADIAPRVKVRGADTAPVALVKGDVRMSVVIERALQHRHARSEQPSMLSARQLTVTLDPEVVNELVTSIAAGGTPYKAARAVLRARLVSLCRQELRERGRYEAHEDWFEKELVAQRDFVGLLDRLWPTVSPQQLVSELLSNSGQLEAAAGGVLDAGEIAALSRERVGTLANVAWTVDDLALLDEANFQINGRTRNYGHIVCDEAQDLSPMQFRMLARRANGSLTVLGDIAQATGANTYQAWEEILPYLPAAAEIRREVLDLGYRAPAQILDLAARLLPYSAPAVPPTASVRAGRFAPETVRVEPGDLASKSIATSLQLASDGLLVGLIVPTGSLETHLGRSARGDARIGQLLQHGITRPVTIIPAASAKGLEFDAVVVVEPALIAGDDTRGLRLLYVALTRPIQRLVILHSLELPRAMI
jgi:DNA helicase IV